MIRRTKLNEQQESYKQGESIYDLVKSKLKIKATIFTASTCADI